VDVDKPPPEGARVIARLSVAEYPDPGDPFAPKTAPIRDVAVTLNGGDVGTPAISAPLRVVGRRGGGNR
jgi:hypothetical protein